MQTNSILHGGYGTYNLKWKAIRGQMSTVEIERNSLSMQNTSGKTILPNSNQLPQIRTDN
jgi:hypothetical protein